MIWIWAIYFTFPGTYSTQPAVTTQVNTAHLYLFLHESLIEHWKETNFQFVCLINHNPIIQLLTWDYEYASNNHNHNVNNMLKDSRYLYTINHNDNDAHNNNNDVVRRLVTSMGAPSMASSSPATLSTTCWWGHSAGLTYTNDISSLYVTMDQSQDCARDWRLGRFLPCPRDLWPLGIPHHLFLSG